MTLPPSRWLSLFYVHFFLGWGIYLPFWSLWLKGQNLTPAIIGLLLGVAQGTRALGSLFITTRIKRSEQLLPASRLLALSTLLIFCGFLLPQSLPLLLGLTLLGSLLYSPLVPISDAMATRLVAQIGMDYGKVRLWGSIAFVVMSTAMGTITGLWGSEAVLWCLLATQLLMFLGTLPAMSVPLTDGPAAQAAKSWWALLKKPMVRRFVLITMCIQGSHAAYYGFSALYWQKQGISPGTIGALWSWGVVVEVAVFYFAKRLFGRQSAAWLLSLGAIAVMVRWTGTAFADQLWQLILLQALHGVTFTLSHLGAIRFISKEIPAHYGVGTQALYSAFGLSLAVAAMMLVTGALYEDWGGKAFLAMAVLGAPALWLCRGLRPVSE
ncbi:3-phenylpropionate MFS transporter [Gallaecimonas kandeliae]|uniref:3-phenylpropionate MFS transporter n=1 Tax=Gallaecimonas kandeliae TaxID=3029055 RepID=UPI0026496085|nr:3-phenylpropionate MFS transporter [Gallaecimonas kandeliae]WKE67079.1 3-phenylpropionate MFS transporter [Gallaecimonas kandeliae]